VAYDRLTVMVTAIANAPEQIVVIVTGDPD
jgi:hypothetical protein